MKAKRKINIKRLLSRAFALCLVGVICFSLIVIDETKIVPDVYASISSIQGEIDKLKQQQEALKAEINATRNDAALERENQQAIEEQIVVTNATIAKLDEYIATLQSQIVAKEQEISDQEIQIANKEQEIDEGIEKFKQRIRVLYVAGNTSMAEILMNSSDFYDMLMRTELISSVAKHDDEFITELINLKNSYENDLVKLEDAKATLEIDKATFEAQCDEWSDELLYLTDLMQQSQENLSQLEQEESAMQADLAALQQLERTREAELKAAIEAAEAANRPYVGGTFTWPVPRCYVITSGVGWRWGSYHKGIDISQPGIAGSPIVAANSGTVIKVAATCTHNYGKYSNCCGNGYGRYVMIDHGGGYVTLYAHMTDVLVSEGQVVTRGEQIGTVGSTGHSTGPHLHFEIRLKNNIENPMNYFSR